VNWEMHSATVIQRSRRWHWGLLWCVLRHQKCVILKIHLEAILKWTYKSILRLNSSNVGYAHGGHNRARLKIRLEAVIDHVGRCIWRL